MPSREDAEAHTISGVLCHLSGLRDYSGYNGLSTYHGASFRIVDILSVEVGVGFTQRYYGNRHTANDISVQGKVFMVGGSVNVRSGTTGVSFTPSLSDALRAAAPIAGPGAPAVIAAAEIISKYWDPRIGAAVQVGRWSGGWYCRISTEISDRLIMSLMNSTGAMRALVASQSAAIRGAGGLVQFIGSRTSFKKGRAWQISSPHNIPTRWAV